MTDDCIFNYGNIMEPITSCIIEHIDTISPTTLEGREVENFYICITLVEPIYTRF